MQVVVMLHVGRFILLHHGEFEKIEAGFSPFSEVHILTYE